MSSGSGGDQQGQGGGFNLQSIVSWAALAAAGVAIWYATSVDSRDQISDLEGSVQSLATNINERPNADAVRQLINETVEIPAPGPSEQDVQGMIDAAADNLRSSLDGDVGAIQSSLDSLGGGLEDVRNALGSTISMDEAEALTAAASEQLMAEQLPELIALNAIPRGAVVAFSTSCPVNLGWREHEDSRGRFLVATGSGTDKNDTEHSFVLGVGTNDGEYSHTLTEAEMPTHQHTVDRQGPTRGIQDVPALGSDGAIIATIEPELTHPTGGGASHNNVPPYIALHFCEKL
jgi:hypothetical protein